MLAYDLPGENSALRALCNPEAFQEFVAESGGEFQIAPHTRTLPEIDPDPAENRLRDVLSGGMKHVVEVPREPGGPGDFPRLHVRAPGHGRGRENRSLDGSDGL